MRTASCPVRPVTLAMHCQACKLWSPACQLLHGSPMTEAILHT